ncbi:helix-turn-helix transcriptional regulator [Shumkonia mesophila]|uniref:helix-turn-helix transcriptional regulator n=1 Tax=Shumkonia mesophila TaxID=2838854 RepID=UPI002934A50E|nr:helix-turn-helix transcriptional regulator [Shumkonia mesophila]
MAELMNTHEVAEYLRLKERKIYDLVREKRIPCTRVTGKWLFPKRLIDAWLAEGTEVPKEIGRHARPAPPVIAGSHDPLLEWCVRESGCDLALLAGGSLDGLRRFAEGEAMVCALHVFDPASGEYNLPVVEALGADGVLIEWARREQGLVVAPGNPLSIRAIADLARPGVRVVLRQQGAGSRILLEHLLERAGVALEALNVLDQPARSETDLGQVISEGRADAGLAVAAAAHAFRLDFVPLWQERCDLLIRRRDYFEAPVQALLAFARTPAFTRRAAEMSGYDVAATGRIVWNAP